MLRTLMSYSSRCLLLWMKSGSIVVESITSLVVSVVTRLEACDEDVFEAPPLTQLS